MATQQTRFAPSTTGLAHPGTLLAALLVYADAAHQNADCLLRLEDLDPQRCKPEYAADMIEALQWLGIHWHTAEYQHRQIARYEAAMDALADAGHLYACDCTRAAIKAAAKPAIDGSLIYPGTCRHKKLMKANWRDCTDAIRCALPDKTFSITDESGIDLSQNPAHDMGDPIVRRKDGAYSYQLVVVVDDQHAGVTRVVRGRDLMHSTATQVALQTLLDYPHPVYRHHLLLLEERDQKLAKFHQSVSWREIAEHFNAEAFIGFLAAGLQIGDGAAMSLEEFVAACDWGQIDDTDRCLLWRDHKLQWGT